ncbi:hypothetical protein [Devosia sp. 2618]|uniref:hypothetical protein n=1 Tax=Devosia sp. 2618 TaxID=3156454 RepID=UPI0033979441
MTDTRIDFAVVGSTTLARLVAGLLANVHGRSVIFAGESQSGYRLPRCADLSIAPITRPETWALLQTTAPETSKLIAKIGGRRALSRVDPVLFAESAAGKEALSHIRHMALPYRLAAEPVPPNTIGDGRDGLLFRDALVLHRAVLEPRLDTWLTQNNVRRMAESESLIVLHDGSARLKTNDSTLEIGQTILADDAAIIEHLPHDQWPANLLRKTGSTITTEPTKPIAAAVMHHLDDGLTLTQQRQRGITAIGHGALDPFSAALEVLLGHGRAFRQAGQSSYDIVTTSDGAPAVGRVQGIGADVLAGFGPTGAFLAPAIARWLSGRPTRGETQWFGDRLVDRAQSAVAEWGARS